MVKKLIAILCGLWLVGCATRDPAQVVVAYFQAVVANQPDQLAELSCAAWEAEARTTAASFRGTGAVLQDVQCQLGETDGDYQIVTCQGKIAVTYQGEKRIFPLGRYRVIQEENAWRMCGEA